MNVHFEERHAQHGYRIGIASLDAEKSLNALSLPMIEALAGKLAEWADDPSIACVLLRGNGPKAFCAGGDVLQLVQACREQPGQNGQDRAGQQVERQSGRRNDQQPARATDGGGLSIVERKIRCLPHESPFACAQSSRRSPRRPP